MSWFGKLLPSRIRTEGATKRNVPEGLWTTKTPIYSKKSAPWSHGNHLSASHPCPGGDRPRGSLSLVSGLEQKNNWRLGMKRRGAILIIVVGLLGAMSMLAILARTEACFGPVDGFTSREAWMAKRAKEINGSA